MPTTYNIAIVGAGPAGCLLARLLLNAKMSVTVFEANDEPRPEGGSLDLHTDTGLAALKQAGLLDRFNELARYDGESFKLLDKRAVAFLDLGGSTKDSSRGRPEIDRPALVHMLADALPAGTIRFGHKLLAVEPDRTLRFEHTTAAGFDLVVGADGAWSRARRAVSDAVPYYVGVTGYESTIPDAAANAPDAHRLARGGSAFCFGDRMFLGLQHLGSGALRTALWRVQPEPRAPDDPAATVQAALADWDPLLRGATCHAAAPPTTCRPLYMLPIGFRWVHRAGVTLVGDAAHLMGPFAGEGVNVALQDVALLATRIEKAARSVPAGGDAGAALSDAVREAEEDMFKRAARFQKQTWDMTAIVFFEDGMPWKTGHRYILTALEDGQPGRLHGLLSVGTKAYSFFINKLRGP